MGDGVWTKKELSVITEAEVISDVVPSAATGLATDGLFEVKSLHGGWQAIYRFANGYGASVVRHRYSYGSEDGLWELAVLKLVDGDWPLTYDTDITDDVIGNLDPEEVDELLIRIKNL